MSKGQRLGYLRVSSVDQNEARQLEGIEIDRSFLDKISGKDRNRPRLKEMIAYAREGDEVFVHSMDRLARNLVDLISIVGELNAKGVKVSFVKENLSFNGDDSPMSVMVLHVMGAFAEFERAIIRERQREGIAAAKARGERTGRPPKLNPAQLAEVRRLAGEGVPKTQLAARFCVHRSTIQEAIKASLVALAFTALAIVASLA